MAERFNILQSLETNQFSTDDASVQISAARILEDTQTGQKYLQVKFVNNGEQPVTGLDIIVKSGDARIAIQHFTDLNLKYGETSGSKTLITIPKEENCDNLNIILGELQFGYTLAHSDAPDFDSSADDSISSKKKLPVQKILLWTSAALLLLSLILSFFNLFLARTLYGDDSYLYESNLWNISSELLDMSYEGNGNGYRLPFSISLGIYGYAISVLLAILYCLFLTEKKRSPSILRAIPFFPFSFQLFLIIILPNRNFVEILDEERCKFVLRSCTLNNSIYLWLACTGAAYLIYSVFLFITHQRIKRSSQPVSQKVSRRLISSILIGVPTVIILILPLIGLALVDELEVDLLNTSSQASRVAEDSTQTMIAEKYGLKEIQYSSPLECALTKTVQSNIEQFFEKREIINSSTDNPIGTLYCIGHIDRAEKNNTYFYTFWEITDQTLTEVSTTSPDKPSQSTTDIPDDLSSPASSANNTSAASNDWKQEYLNYISADATYCLDDLDGNGIPELFEFFDGSIQLCWYAPGEGVGGDDITYIYYGDGDTVYYVKDGTSSVILVWTYDGYDIGQFKNNDLSSVLLAYESSTSSGDPAYILYQNFEEKEVTEDEYYSAQDEYMSNLAGSNWWDIKNEAYGAYNASEIKAEINAY